MADRQRPAELVLTAAVARRHYLLYQSHKQIAEELGISRFKVARLIEAARTLGLVRIEIVRQGALDLDLSAQLQERFGLAHSVVLDGDEGDELLLRSHLGAAAANLLAEVVTEGDVVGLPWSRSVHALVEALGSLAPVDVVQLTGAMAQSDEDSSAVDLVRRVARVSGGTAHVFYAPFILDDPESAAALRRQPAVAEGMAQVSRVTKAVVGVGRWAEGQSTIHDAVGSLDREDVARAGVIGEVAGVFFDSDGDAVRPRLAERLITLSHEELRAVPEVIAVVSGAHKAAAVQAALRGEFVDGLVVDAHLATALLQ